PTLRGYLCDVEDVQQDLTAERIARNDSTFRESNERIEEAAERYGLRGPIPFICECADPNCVQLIRLTPADYEEVRSIPTWFAVVPGHDQTAGPHARVVREHETYAVVEKLGEAAEIA